MKVAALLLGAGRGERLGADVPKALVPLAGRPLFAWSLEALEASSAVEAIVVVGPSRAMRESLAACGLAPRKVIGFCEGGRERQHSVAKGLATLPPDVTHVAVHDAARAMLTPEIVNRVVGAAVERGAAIAAMPLEDTLKRATLQVVTDTVPRAGLWRAQTPQVFRRDWLEQAHAEAHGLATDDAALVEAIGHPVHLVEADARNFKVTTPADLALAEAWLTARGPLVREGAEGHG